MNLILSLDQRLILPLCHFNFKKITTHLKNSRILLIYLECFFLKYQSPIPTWFVKYNKLGCLSIKMYHAVILWNWCAPGKINICFFGSSNYLIWFLCKGYYIVEFTLIILGDYLHNHIRPLRRRNIDCVVLLSININLVHITSSA